MEEQFSEWQWNVLLMNSKNVYIIWLVDVQIAAVVIKGALHWFPC